MSLVSLRAYYCNMNPSRRPLARGVAGRGVERRAEHRAERRAEHRAPSQYRSRARACRAPRPAGVPARTRRLLINIRQRFNIYSKRFIDCRVTFETLELHFKRFQYKNNMIHDFKIIFVYFFYHHKYQTSYSTIYTYSSLKQIVKCARPGPGARAGAAASPRSRYA